jgi:hypothetical protein
MRHGAGFWIEHLHLEKHVEGGAFREVYRSDMIIPQQQLPTAFNGDRNISTSIYFLLEQHQYSAFHRIASDELWHFYAGDCLLVYEIEKATGSLIIHKLGSDPLKGQVFQALVKAGNWFASSVEEGGEYTLAGCTVSPGFDFKDFALAERSILTTLYPQHAALIAELTRASER